MKPPITHHRLPSSACPGCGTKVDCSTHFGDRRPEPGDVSICFYCASLLQFNNSLHLEAISEEELSRLPQPLQRKLIVGQHFVRQRVQEQARQN